MGHGNWPFVTHTVRFNNMFTAVTSQHRMERTKRPQMHIIVQDIRQAEVGGGCNRQQTTLAALLPQLLLLVRPAAFS